MKRNRLFSFIAIVLLLVNTFSPMTVLAYGVSNKSNEQQITLDEKVLKQFEEDEFVKLLVVLKDQVDSENLRLQGEKEARLQQLNAEQTLNHIRHALVNELQQTANSTQGNVEQFLSNEMKKGNVKEYTSFFIVNGFAVTANKEIAEKLLSFPEVKSVLLDEVKELEPVNTAELSKLIQEKAASDEVEWHIERIKAPEVWEKGYTGEGIVVANIDSGVDGDHPALKTKYRGYNPEDPNNPNHEFNWFDPAAGRSIPLDSDGHGTHTMGTMVGYEEGMTKIGVAPGAKWIAARAFYLGTAYDSNIIAAGQWVLAPTDNEGVPHPEMAPDIVNNSWGGTPYNNDWYRPIVQAWRAAGIAPIFSVGNAGFLSSSSPGSANAPANYPESIAVGATDQNDELASFSLRGPTERGDIKPDLVAPGVGIVSSVPGERWDEFEYEADNGTSMAAPQVAGTIALMKQVDPTLTIDEIETILKLTAVELDNDEYEDYPNNGYGYGMLNALAAVEAVERGIGTISGQITYEGFDSEAPNFEHDVRKTVFLDTENHFSIRAVDNISVNNVTLHIELDNGDKKSYEANLTSGDHTDGIYEVLVPSEDIYGESLTYKWEIEDFSGQITYTDTYDVEIKDGVTAGYFQDFESYPDGWYSFGRFNSWEWGEPTFGPDSAASGTKVVGTNLRGLYAMDADMTLMMPPVLVEGNMQLRFKQWYELSWFGHDKGKVFISEDGETWDEVFQIISDNKTWHEVGIDLSSYAGKKVFIAFNLTSMDNEFPGWYIDDVQLVSESTEGIAPTGKKNVLLNSYKKEFFNSSDETHLLPVEAEITVLETGWKTKTNLKDGTFTIHHNPGTYTLKIEAYGFETVTEEVDITADETTSYVKVIEPKPREIVSGTVSGVIGGVEGATVSFVQDGKTTTTMTDENGQFAENLMAGHYDVYVNAEGFDLATATIDVKIGEPLELEFILQPFLRGNEDEIFYDNGRYSRNLAFGFKGSGFAVKMSLEDDQDSAMLTGAKLQFWAGHVPVPGGEDILISVYDATGIDGAPGRKLAGPVEAKAVRSLYEWTEVDLSHLGLVVTGDFYILYQQADDMPYVPGFVSDGDRNNAAGRSWDYIGGQWFKADDSLGNYMIRAVVDYGVEAPDIDKPVITTPTDNTFVKDEDITVKGFASPNSTVQLIYNGAITSETTTDDGGNFTFEATLESKHNTFAVVELVNDTPFVKSDPVQITWLTEAPQIIITSPEEGEIVMLESVTVEGEVIGEYVSTVTVNGKETNLTDGYFSATVTLKEGSNTITVVAEDIVGNQTTETIEVIYQPFEPEITHISPDNDLYLFGGDLVRIVVETNVEKGEASFSMKLPILQTAEEASTMNLVETEPGIYEGTWLVPYNMKVDGIRIEVEVTDQLTGKSIRQTAEGKLYISTEKVDRIKGDTRFGTAVGISQSGWTKADTVVLARSDDYADALAGVPLAYALDAPILLTRPTNLPKETLDEIKRLGAEKVIVLGGEGAISSDIVAQLEEVGLNVERISGSTRTATAVEIAKRLAPEGTDKAVVVNGFDFPDALSVASQAAIQGMPILLTQANALSDATAEALAELGVTETIVVGGKSVVSDEVMNELPNAERVSGSDRVETNIAVQNYFNVDARHIYVATGNNFADTLTGAVLAAKNNSSILLVRNSLFDVTKDFITENNIKRITIFGGTTAVNEQIEADLNYLLLE